MGLHQITSAVPSVPGADSSGDDSPSPPIRLASCALGVRSDDGSDRRVLSDRVSNRSDQNNRSHGSDGKS